MRIRNYIRAFNVLLFLSVIGWVVVDGRLLNFVERNEPIIEWMAVPQAVGRTGKKIALRVMDDGAGIKDVSLTVSLNSADATKSRVVFEEVYAGSDLAESKMISFILDPARFALEQGHYKLVAVAHDSSLWSNKVTDTREFEVDLRPPQIQVLSRHHYGQQGGTLVVVYATSDLSGGSSDARSGVRLGQQFYPGFKVESSSKIANDTYLALVPIASDYSEGQAGAFEVLAEDSAGNISTASFNQSIKAVKRSFDTFKLGRSFFLKVLPNLAPALDTKYVYQDWAQLDTEKLAQIFKHVNKDLRSANVAKIREVTKSSSGMGIPSVLIKPMPAKLTASYAERRQYFSDDLDLGKSVHEGYDLASLERAPVYAAAGGIVRFAGDLGIYGNAIIVDHGYGLVSLYGHLSSTQVKVDDQVIQAAPIGTTGETGLAGGDHLHFEVRVHGEAVDPREWLDPNWVSTRIEEPLAAASGS